MREIKFRAWDSTNKKMHFDIGVINGKCIPLYGETWVVEQTKPYPNMGDIDRAFKQIEDGIILMQFTGLLDKQGKEIYEGDIVRIWDYGFKNGNEDGDFDLYQDMGIDKVTMNRFPVYWLENEEFGYEGEDLINPEHCEVIGNIYENASLLDKS